MCERIKRRVYCYACGDMVATHDSNVRCKKAKEKGKNKMGYCGKIAESSSQVYAEEKCGNTERCK